LREVIDRGLLASYVFVHERRARLAEMLRELSPDPQKYRVFLMSTGSEATENCIKLSKTYGLEKHGPHKKYVVSFRLRLPRAHDGRPARRAAWERQKQVDGRSRSPAFVQVPFP
jgi:4-aminobutyrate aminotransferase/(S)-3-amino-2-methylpropionate transaminase